MPLLFVGERRSRTAMQRGYSWPDQRLCGRTLAQALAACGIALEQYRCMNVYTDEGALDRQALTHIRTLHAAGWVVVGLGRTVQRVLTVAGIPHRAMIHPAARGRRRKREAYQQHVAAIVLRHTTQGGSYRTAAREVVP